MSESNEILMIIFYRTCILNFIELQRAFLKMTHLSKFRQGMMNKMDGQWSNTYVFSSLLPVLNLFLLLFLFSYYFILIFPLSLLFSFLIFSFYLSLFYFSCSSFSLLLYLVLFYSCSFSLCCTIVSELVTICYRRHTPKRDLNSWVLWRHDKHYLTRTSVGSDSVRDNWTGCFRFLNWMKKLYDLKLLLLYVGVSKTRNKAEYFVSSRSPERMGCMWLVPTRTQLKLIKHCM